MAASRFATHLRSANCSSLSCSDLHLWLCTETQTSWIWSATDGKNLLTICNLWSGKNHRSSHLCGERWDTATVMEAVNEESSSARLQHEIRINQKQKIPHLSPECWNQGFTDGCRLFLDFRYLTVGIMDVKFNWNCKCDRKSQKIYLWWDYSDWASKHKQMKLFFVFALTKKQKLVNSSVLPAARWRVEWGRWPLPHWPARWSEWRGWWRAAQSFCGRYLPLCSPDRCDGRAAGRASGGKQNQKHRKKQRRGQKYGNCLKKVLFKSHLTLRATLAD